MLSEKFVAAVKLGPKRAYEVAQEAGIHPSTLSKLMCGIERAKTNDKRIIAVAKVLGITAEDCFQEEEELD